MGVYNLWKLLAAAGRKVDMQSLRGTRVAIDVSIWMIKILHGMSKAGVNFENVHLIGILKRIMYLMEFGIKPVFVFDGPPPDLKRQTLIMRAQQRQLYNLNIQKLAEKYVVRLIEKGVNIEQAEEQEIEEILELDTNSQLPPEEQEIVDQRNHDILNLQFEYMNGKIPGFYDLDLQSKEEIIQQLIEAKGENYVDDQHFQIKKFLAQAEQRDKIRQISIEAVKQIETLRVEKILEQYNDKESQLLKEYMRKNEDLVLKVGQFGINNIYVYLQDQDKRKDLVKQLYGEKNNKKRKLKDYEIENQHLQTIREALRKRYRERLQFKEEEEPVNQVEQEEQVDLMDIYDCYDLDMIEQKLDEEIRAVEQANKNEKQQEFYSEEQVPVQVEEQVINLSPENKEFSEIEQSIDEESENSNDEQEIDLPVKLKSQYNQQPSEKQQDSVSQIQSSKRKDFQQKLEINVQHEDVQQQFLDLSPKAEERKPQQSSKKQPTDAELDQLLTQIEYDEQNDNLTAQEMLENLRRNQNLQSLDTASMQNKFEEIRYLLSLFGIPWIMAPGEAEAQCAFLQQNNLVDCVITEDSDVFLFGATRVLKGFFERETNLTYYDSKYIKQDLGLTRDQLIYLALFLGSDYTIGIKGVGIVNAMEIVEVFDNVDALKRFQQWASKADILLQNAEQHYENIPEKERIYKEFHKNYKKYWEMPSNFPDQEVIQAYLKPRVDESLEQFTWAKPAVDKIIEFCQNNLQFSEQRIEETIRIPFKEVLKNQTDQTKITDFFKVTTKIAIINSKRINKVVLNLNQPEQSLSVVQSAKKRKLLKELKQQPQKRCEDGDDLDLDNYVYQKQFKK